MSFNLAVFERLSASEQIFAITNIERVNRGLVSVMYMTTQLNRLAQVGASNDTDPEIPSVLTGGAMLTAGGSIWAEGSTPAWADDGWMYNDGWGGSTNNTMNEDCSSPSARGCWGHRDIILMANPGTGCYTAAGAAAASGGSVSEVFVQSCGAVPSDVVVMWSALESSLLPTKPIEIDTQLLPKASAFTNVYSTWIEVAHGTSAYSVQVTGGSLPPHYRLTVSGHLLGPLSDPRTTYRFKLTATTHGPTMASASKWFTLSLPPTRTPN
jgi:hypothetical protein